MLCTDRNGIAKTKRKSFKRTRRTGAAFTLIGNKNGWLARSANEIGESAIGRHRAGPRIDQEQDRIGLFDGLRGLRLHPRRKTIARGVFETCRIDNFERQIAELGITLAPIARHARLVVDQRHAAPNQTVEQRRFTDIGAPNDRDREILCVGGHGTDNSRTSQAARRLYLSLLAPSASWSGED